MKRVEAEQDGGADPCFLPSETIANNCITFFHARLALLQVHIVVPRDVLFLASDCCRIKMHTGSSWDHSAIHTSSKFQACLVTTPI